MITITANIIDKNSGIYYYMHTAEMLRQTHLHDGFAEVMIMLRGHLTHSADNITESKQAGDLIFMPCDTVHTLSNGDDDVMFLNMAVLPTTLAQAVSYLHLAEVPSQIVYNRVPQEVLNYILWNHKTVLESVEAGARDVAIRNSLALLLPYCCTSKRDADWFDMLLIQMKKQENFHEGVARMQQLSFCSPSHLSRTCKARIAMTPTQYVEKTRVEYAAHLLRHTSFAIREVAEECGFGNLGYFYRCFERRIGTTPGIYRNSIIPSNING